MDYGSLPRRRFLRTSALAGVSAAVLPALATARDVPCTASAPGDQAFRVGRNHHRRLCKREWRPENLPRARSPRNVWVGLRKSTSKVPRSTACSKSIPDALAIADALDRERKANHARGPMHGIPVLIKDNIDTADRMQTTAGSLALVGSKPTRDSFVAQKLRESGAVILGKTNLSEWANIRSSHSSSGWSGRGGQTTNPYALDRNPCGSSSGSGAAISASLCAVAVGSETDGSIVCPASANGIVGIKPTLGLISRSGIIPIAHSQDTAGPMARSVRDAAILLGALAGADPRDSATAASAGKAEADYTKFLDPHGLRGARIGVARKYFGSNDAQDQLMNNLIAAIKRQGAEIVDPADLPTHGKFDDTEFLVLLYELKADLNAYLAARPGAPGSLKDIIDFNESNRDKEMPYFGQDIFIKSEAKGPLTSKEYTETPWKRKSPVMARKEGIDAVMDQFHLGRDYGADRRSGMAHRSGQRRSRRRRQLKRRRSSGLSGYHRYCRQFVFGLPVGIKFFGHALT